jgi:hypothetical protein
MSGGCDRFISTKEIIMTNANVNVIAKRIVVPGMRVKSPFAKKIGTVKVVIPYAETSIGKGEHVVVQFDDGHIAVAPSCHYTFMKET